MGARAGRRQLLHGSMPRKHHARSSSHSPACLPHHHHLPSESRLLVEPLHFFTVHSNIFPFFNFSPYTAIAPQTHQPGQDPRPAQTTSSGLAKAGSRAPRMPSGVGGAGQHPEPTPPPPGPPAGTAQPPACWRGSGRAPSRAGLCPRLGSERHRADFRGVGGT